MLTHLTREELIKLEERLAAEFAALRPATFQSLARAVEEMRKDMLSEPDDWWDFANLSEYGEWSDMWAQAETLLFDLKAVRKELAGRKT